MTSKEFFEKALKDEVLTKKFQKVKSCKEAYELAKANGLTDDSNTYYSEAKKYVLANTNISKTDVESVIGGSPVTTPNITVTTGCAVPTTAAAGAAET